MTARQDQAADPQLQTLQLQEGAISKQLSAAEARLKSYEQEFAKMGSNERELNMLVRQNRQTQVMDLRGQLDEVRLKIQEIKAGNVTVPPQVIARVEDGPLVVAEAPVTASTVEAPHFFGLEPRQFREPALFILALPLILALSRWIWRRTPARTGRDSSLEGNAQITRLEQAVEAIAIEVERIGEAQRFSAKLMAERPKEPVIERIRESVKSPRKVVTPLP